LPVAVFFVLNCWKRREFLRDHLHRHRASLPGMEQE
jgi:hypothetical protein